MFIVYEMRTILHLSAEGTINKQGTVTRKNVICP